MFDKPGRRRHLIRIERQCVGYSGTAANRSAVQDS